LYIIPYALRPILPALSCNCIMQSDRIVLWATIFFDEISQLLPVLHIGLRGVELHATCRVIVAILHSTNHNHECCIWQHRDVTCRFFACSRFQSRRQWLVASPSLLPRLPNLTCTLLQTRLNPLSPNPFSITKDCQRQRFLETLQKFCNLHLPVQGAISQLLQTVLSRDNGPMLLFEKLSHPYFLPLVECSKVGVPHSCGKLLHREFRSLQDNWGFAWCPAQVR
jgi:hypothetical protein